VDVVRLPPKIPNLSAYAERFVGSLRRECLNRLVLLTERHLRKVVLEYAAHYRFERNHQVLGKKLADSRPVASNTNGEIHCRRRLVGRLRLYSGTAA
jgi:putative transposase